MANTETNIISRGTKGAQGLLRSHMNLGGAMGLGFGVMMYNDEREKGHGVLRSAVGAVGTDMFYKALGGAAGMGLMGIQLGGAAIPAGYNAYKGYAQSLMRSTRAFSSGYQDTQGAYTMRQKALQEIQKSRLNARSGMGNEAQYMHR